MLLVAIAVATTVRPQEAPRSRESAPGAGSPVTLDGAIQEALAHNLSYQSELEQVGVARGLLLQAKAIPNPVGSGSATSDRSFANEGEKGWTAGLEQEFETVHKRRYRMLGAQSELERVQHASEAAQQDIVRRATQAFFALLRSRRDLDLANEDLTILQHLVDLTDNRVRLGEAAGLDLNLVQIELARTQRELLEFGRSAHQALVELDLVLGREAERPIHLAGDFPPPSPIASTDGYYLAATLQRRPEILAAESELVERQHQEQLAKALGVPNLTLGAGYQEDNRVVATTAVGSVGIRKDRAFVLSVAVPLPIFNRNRGNVEAAHHEALSADAGLKYLRSAVEAEVRVALANYRSRLAVRDLYESSILPPLRKSLDSIVEAYRLGNESVFAVIQAQRTFFDTRHEYLAALFDAENERAQLRRALGLSPSESLQDLGAAPAASSRGIE